METKLKVKEKTPMGYILENGCLIEDTFAEMFPMWTGRILITAENEKWALIAARTATGFASSIIMSPAEAGIERVVSQDETPDGRTGTLIQIYHRTRRELRVQMIQRISQCVMTCPTTAVFDALPEAVRRLKVGRKLRLFADGFQRKDTMFGRTVWRIPVTEGEFIIEEKIGIQQGIAGGMFLIFAKNQKAGLTAAERASEAIRKVENVILTFPGGICRSGSKVGSHKYPKLKATTNETYCPTLKDKAASTFIPENVNSVYELVFDGLTLESVKKAMTAGLKAATSPEGIVKIKAANYGGKLGPYKLYLKEAL